MNTIYVWILILHSWDGGMLKVENIASWEDCERMRLRAEASAFVRRTGGAITGACTQVGILVPPPPTINIPALPAPVVNNRIIMPKVKTP